MQPSFQNHKDVLGIASQVLGLGLDGQVLGLEGQVLGGQVLGLVTSGLDSKSG